MKLETSVVEAKGSRISCKQDGLEVGRAFVYIMHNDLHQRPFALMEDVYVSKAFRGQGLGSKIVRQVIQLAQEANCYKLLATSRDSRTKVHDLYQRLGFTQHGVEFRMDL